MFNEIQAYEYTREDRCPDKDYESYDILSEKTIKCDNCGINLADIIVVKESSRKSKTKAICPLCDVHSFYYSTNGEIYMAVHENNGLALSNIDTVFENDIFINIIRLNKNV